MSGTDAGLSTYNAGGGSPVVCADGGTPNMLSVNVDEGDGGAQTVIPGGIFGVLMERIGTDITNGLYVGTSSSTPNTGGMRNDIIQGFKDAHVDAIEWPGGCAANSYNWQPPAPSNDMGTDDYMLLTSTLGIDPLITGSGSSSDANRNLAWVTYINNSTTHPTWDLKTFKVGNEVWGCGGNQTESQYETNYLANYNVLSPPIGGKQLTIVASTGLIDNWSTWLMPMLTGSMKGKFDGIEVHDYIYHPDDIPCTGFSDDQYYNVVNAANTGQIGPRVQAITAMLDMYDPSNHIKIYEDEWGDWLESFPGGGPSGSFDFQQITVMDAISTAETLHIFMQYARRYAMAGLAQAINTIHSLFLTNSAGALVKTPAFYVFEMFAPHHACNAELAPNTLSSEMITGNGSTFPVLSAGSTVDSAGHVNISLTNVDLVNTRSVQIAVNSSSHGAYNVSTAQIVTGPQKDSYNDFGVAEAVNVQILPATSYAICGKTLNVTLPPKSVVMLVLTPQ